MKALYISALFILLAAPATAQDSNNLRLPSPAVTNLPAGSYQDRGPLSIQRLSAYCVAADPHDGSTQGICSAQQLAAGGRVLYNNQTFSGGGSTAPVMPGNSLPASLATGDSTIGVQISGYYKDALAPSGLSYMQGNIPLSYFAQADQVMAQQQQIVRDQDDAWHSPRQCAQPDGACGRGK